MPDCAFSPDGFHFLSSTVHPELFLSHHFTFDHERQQRPTLHHRANEASSCRPTPTPTNIEDASLL
jgi:hypothetical protein